MAPSRSITPPPLTITPARAARETPEINATGAARISGHGVATTNTARARTGSPEIAQASAATSAVNGQEDDRVAVGKAHERRLLGLHLPHQPYEGGVGALATRAGPPAASKASPAFVVPLRTTPPREYDDRQRLSGQRRLVDGRVPGDDDAVDGNDFTRPHEDDVPDRHVVDRYLGNRALPPHVGDARSALDERRQLAARAAARPILEPVATGEHQRDNGSRGVLPEREGARHGDERDRVDADVASQERAQRPTTRAARASGPPWPPRATSPASLLAGQVE